MRAPAQGTALRAAVIRGDVASVGIVAVLGGAGLAVAALVGLVPLATLALALALAVAGVVAIRWSQRAWRALVAEVGSSHRGEDPGPSPVPWVDDAVWRDRNRFDPELDASALLLREVDPLAGVVGATGGAFTGVVLRPVTPDERSLAEVTEVHPGEPVPEGGDAAEVIARLEATPGRFLAVAPRWPICCGHPTTLASLRPDSRDPRALWLAPEPAGDLQPEVARERGVHGYRCRACGRRYATDPGF